MRVAYIDCRRGVSGTSVLGALIDAGVERAEISDRLTSLARRDEEQPIVSEDTTVDGFRCRTVTVPGSDERLVGSPGEIASLLAAASLSARATALVTEMYRRIAEAEARSHGVALDDVRFHELGTRRSLIGTIGTAVALELSGVEELVASPLPFGHGTAMTAHGEVTLPAPATLELLRGMPVEPQAAYGELVTPTGAAILAAAASSFGSIPPLTIDGIGRGMAKSSSAPIVTQVVLGRQ